MTCPRTFRRYLIALLLIAQLGGVLHAADHGPGEHAHDGVACILCAALDDDLDSAPPPSGLERTPGGEPVTPVGAAEGVRTVRGILVPPATGPPVSP